MHNSEHYLVVGSGSIAHRHIANLKSLYASSQVSCVSASGRTLTIQETGADKIFSSLAQAIQVRPKFAIVASPSTLHTQHMADLISAGIPVLVEKPVADSLESIAPQQALFQANLNIIDVGYNLRFMPSAIKLKALLSESLIGRIHSIQADVGQYLPDWRPHSDYRNNVSAQATLGGGALLELSHEIDYLRWLFGEFDRVFCYTRKSGHLDIDVDDCVDALFTNSEGTSAHLHMDFLQRHAERCCKVIGDTGTLHWDIMKNRITLRTKDSETVLFDDPAYDRNDMYIKEIESFASMIDNHTSPSVGLPDALRTLAIIEAMRKSSRTGQVVSLRGIQ